LANVVPIFKKDDRQSKENYRPISLLPSLSKICEKIVFVRLYNFLLEINFLNLFQSRFRPGDSTVNQLIFIVHKIHEALELGKEVRMVFLDISKAFDKVWQKGLLFKLERLGVRSGLSLRQSSNTTLPFVRTERFKKSFFPWATMLWNSVEYSVRSLPSINLFKKAILKFFEISCDRNHSYFDHSIDRYTSVLHARLRLNCCALNYYLLE
jgi:hypothetical protein